MGKQDGVILITGNVGGLTFFKNKDGHQVRKSGGVAGDRIKNDPAFVRTRENLQEFGRAARASRQLRSALRSLVLKNKDSRMASRLMSAMMKVVQADTTHARGMRLVLGPNAALLEGFEFNASASLASTLHAPFTAAIDRVTGNLEVNVPAFVPQDMITPPQGATHARLIAGAVELNMTDGTYVTSSSQGDPFLINEQALPVTTLPLALTPNSLQPLFLVFGITFHQEVNGALYPIKNGTFNAMALVKIDGGV